MLRFFKSRRPKHRAEFTAQPITREDIAAANAWGLTLTDWYGMTDFERRECRRNITAAPKFVP
jgi:hypothetical protein